MLVYFLEYVILPGCAAKVNPESEASKVWAVKHAYVVLSFCYQFGVLISRSSLSVLRISWVELLTALQVRARGATNTKHSISHNPQTNPEPRITRSNTSRCFGCPPSSADRCPRRSILSCGSWRLTTTSCRPTPSSR